MRIYYNLVYILTPCNGRIERIDNEYLSFEYIHSKDSREMSFISIKRDQTMETFYSFSYFHELHLNIWNEKYFRDRLLKNIKSGKYHYPNWTSGSRDIEINKGIIKDFEKDPRITYDNILYSTMNLPIDEYKRSEIKTRNGYRLILLELPGSTEDPAKFVLGILKNGNILEIELNYEGFYQGKLIPSISKEFYYNFILGGGTPESHFIPMPKEIGHNKRMDCTFDRIMKTLELKK
jgi:hypothetical protein